MRKQVFLFLSCLFLCPPFSFSQTNTYGGRDQELWIQDVIRIASKIRIAESNYEKFYRECDARDSLQHTTNARDESAKSEGEQGNEACKKAEAASSLARQARKQYQILLDQAALASLPVDWLRAHYAWVRWGPEWDRSKNWTDH